MVLMFLCKQWRTPRGRGGGAVAPNSLDDNGFLFYDNGKCDAVNKLAPPPIFDQVSAPVCKENFFLAFSITVP